MGHRIDGEGRLRGAAGCAYRGEKMERSMPIQESFTAEEIRTHRKAIARALAPFAKEWGIVGWAFLGKPDALTLHVRISPAHEPPEKAERVISLEPGHDVLVKIEQIAKLNDFFDTGDPPVRKPIAPGAPILVGRKGARLSGGMAAVVVLGGKKATAEDDPDDAGDGPHLLTCGHLFSGPADVFAPSEDEPIATLTKSYMSGDDKMDFAVCRLTPRGMSLLQGSADEQTWLTGGARAPAPDMLESVPTFWPTHAGSRSPIEVTITADNASTSMLFDGNPGDGFIELDYIAIEGDSGSLLSINDDYVGICSGEIDAARSYFTPIAAALDRLLKDYNEVHLWTRRDFSDGSAAS
jgi:hypothetical protein